MRGCRKCAVMTSMKGRLRASTAVHATTLFQQTGRQESRHGEVDDDEKKPDSFAHVWIVAVECKHFLK